MCRLWGRAQNIGVDEASCRRRETPVVPTVGEETEQHERMSTKCHLILPSFPPMATTSSNIVFDDIFTLNAIDKEGKKFDRGVVLISM